jgi:hypothetical protein
MKPILARSAASTFSAGAARATLIAWGVALGSLLILLVVYILRVSAAAGLTGTDALARFDFATWRSIDATIVVVVAATMALGLVRLRPNAAGLLQARAAALAFESFAASLAIAVPVLSLLMLIAFALGPGPCGSSFYNAREPACAARDAGLLTNLLVGLLALGFIPVLLWAVVAIAQSISASALLRALMVTVGTIGGLGTGVSLTGLVSTAPLERLVENSEYITGAVTDLRTGAPIKSRIDVFRADSPCCVSVDEAFTQEGGKYELKLAPGRYRILFVPFDQDVPVAAEWWKSANSFESSAVVTMPRGGEHIDAQLRTRAHVTGRVTSAATSFPIAGMSVSAVLSLTGRSQNRPVAHAASDADGRFSLQLPAGTYFVQFDKIGFLPSVWRDARVAGGTPSSVAVSDRDLTNIDQVVPAPRR